MSVRINIVCTVNISNYVGASIYANNEGVPMCVRINIVCTVYIS